MKSTISGRLVYSHGQSRINKKWVFLIYLVCALLLSAFFFTYSGGRAQVASAAERPNFVVILVDDLSNSVMQTLLDGGHLPNIKTHIIDAGTTFENSFVTTAVCCPARATLLTGQYTHNHGVLGNLLPNGGVTMLDDTTTLSTWLQDSGYVTALVGKYLNGYGSDGSAPADSPLDPKYVPPGYDHWQVLVDDVDMYNYDINNNGRIRRYGNRTSDYQTDVLADLSARFIKGADNLADSSPFFLHLTPTAPHAEGLNEVRISGCDNVEWSRTIRPARRHEGFFSSLPLPRPPSFNEADMSDKSAFLQANLPLMTDNDIACAQEQFRNQAEAMLAVDDLVGTVVDELIRRDELNDTVIIFTSDNGYFHGEHRLFQKLVPFEEAIRVPLYIRAPGYVAGQSVSQYAINNDLAPTISELAGVTPGRAVDGRSLLPVMQDPSLATWRQRFLIEFLGRVRIDLPNFSGVRTSSADGITPDQVYISWDDGNVEYYDLTTDPDQLQSQHDNTERASERQQLQSYLNDLSTCSNGSCQTFED